MIAGWLTKHAGGRQSLRRQALTGAQWLLIRSAAVSGIELLRSMLFLRLLNAHDYGVMGLAVLAPGLVRAFTVTGTDVMIQRAGDDVEEQLPHYWTINAVRGAAAVVALWLLAFVLARFYGMPELLWPIRALSVPLLLESLGGFGVQLRQRRMDFKPVAAAGIVSELAVATMSLVAVFFWRNYWAIVLHYGGIALAGLVCSYALRPWRPRWAFDPRVAKGVALFALSAIALNVFNYIHVSLDRGIVGRLFTVEDVGFYTRAHFLALLPVQCLATAVAQVFLPAFRAAAGDVGRLRRAFAKTAGTLACLYTALGVALYLAARPFILIVAGEQWLGIVPLFRVLLLYGVSKSIVLTVGPIFHLYKKPMLLSLCAGVMAGAFTLLALPMTRNFGLSGMAWAVVLSGLLSHALAFALVAWLLRKGSLPHDAQPAAACRERSPAPPTGRTGSATDAPPSDSARFDLIVTSDFPPVGGGIATYFDLIARSYPGPAMVLTSAPQTGADRERPLVVKRIGNLGPFTPILYFLSVALRLPKRRIRFIHCGQMRTVGLACLLLKRMFGIPYGIHVYGGERAKFADKPFWRFLLKPVLDHASILFAISRWTRQQWIDYGVKPDRIVVVNPPVDTERYHPLPNPAAIRAALGLCARQQVLLSICRLDPHKGTDMVLRAMPELVASFPDILFVVGGAGRMLPALRALARELNVEKHVRFIGRVPENEMIQWYNAAEIFVMPSRSGRNAKGGAEGFGIVYLEANLCGRAVIGGRSGGTADAIEDGVSGMLVDPESVPAIVGAATTLLRDPALRETLGANGRKRAIERFSAKACSRKLYEAVSGICP